MLNRKWPITAGSLLIAALVSSGGSAIAASQPSGSPPADTGTGGSVTSIELSSGVSGDAAEEIASSMGATLSEVRQVISVDGIEITVGIGAEADGKLPADLPAVTGRMIEGLLGQGPAGTRSSVSEVEPLESQVAAAIDQVANDGPLVDRLDVVGIDSDATLPEGAQLRATPASPDAVAADGYQPAFNENYSYSDNIGRYNTLRFEWTATNLSNLIASGSNTFEPDFITNNFDGAYFFGDVLNWSSTLPDAYLDTNFLDAPEERVYTIGTATNSKLSSGVSYSTFFQAGVGNAATDSARVTWQRGTYVFGCPFGPAACIFGDESLFGPSDIPIPGRFTGVV